MTIAIKKGFAYVCKELYCSQWFSVYFSSIPIYYPDCEPFLFELSYLTWVDMKLYWYFSDIKSQKAKNFYYVLWKLS